MAYMIYCPQCQSYAPHSGIKCLGCYNREQEKQEADFYNLPLEDKVDYLYKKIKEIEDRPSIDTPIG